MPPTIAGSGEPAVRAEGDRREADRDGRSGERAQMLVAKERHLALAGPRAVRVVDDAEEHQRAPESGRDRPRDEDDEKAVEVDHAAEEQADGGREQCVLGVLRHGREVGRGVAEWAPEARGEHQAEKERGDDPEHAPAAERFPAELHAGRDRRGQHDHDREVGAVDVTPPKAKCAW